MWWDDAIKKDGKLAEIMVHVFGTRTLTEARLDRVRRQIVVASNQGDLANWFQTFSGKLTPYALQPKAVNALADELITAVFEIDRKSPDPEVAAHAFQATTKFIGLVNAYPPVAGRNIHQKLAVVGQEVLRVLSGHQGIDASLLHWATGLAFQAAGNLGRAGYHLEHSYESLSNPPSSPPDLGLAVACDYARLMLATGSYKKAIKISEAAEQIARQEPGNAFRAFVARENMAFAHLALGRADKAQQLLLARELKSAGIKEAVLPLPSQLSLRMFRLLLDAMAGDASREAFESHVEELLELSTEGSYPMPNFAATQKRVLELLQSKSPDQEVYENIHKTIAP